MSTICGVLKEVGYKVINPIQILKAINYNVPQKRERVFIVAIRDDINLNYKYPIPNDIIYNLEDALKKGNYMIQMFQSLMVKSTMRKKENNGFNFSWKLWRVT